MYHSGRHSHRLSLLRAQRAWSDGLATGRGRASGGRHFLLQQQPPQQQHRLLAPPSLGRRGLSSRPEGTGAAAAAAAASPFPSPKPSGRPSFVLVLRRGSGLVGLCSLVAAMLDGNPFLAPASSTSCAPGPGQQGPTGRGSRPQGDDDDADSIIRTWLHNALGPVGGEATFGCIVGFSSGYALKKVGKAAAFFIGVGFLAAQTLHWIGYIDVNWAKLERHLLTLLDRDGDDKLTERDLQYYWAKAKECLTYQLPSTGGFVTGFAVGFIKG